MTDTDKHWVRLGLIDPYLNTVKTLDPYKLDPNLAHEANPYFASGEHYVGDLFESIGRLLGQRYRPRTALDFGCSVGRVAIPLARRCEAVIGLDVSPDALTEAARNATGFGLSNLTWSPSDDELSNAPDRIDLFHSYNVLQHLPVQRGLRIVRHALGRLQTGGVIAVHFPYADRGSRLRRAINWAQARVPGVHSLANLARRRPHDYPHMMMTSYDLTSFLALLNENDCKSAYCKFVDQGRYPGAIVIARVGVAFEDASA
jgi:SAM-dependent methyltransferase